MNCDVPPPMYLTVPGQDVRLHVKAMQIGDVVRKSMFVPKTKSGTGSGWGSLLESIGAGVVTVSGKDKPVVFPLGGASSRVDFSFQPYVIDNEYIR